ncbi:MAG: GHKL domain-containing protein [Chitinophagales bacterium]|nr:GHKL domain-containing protein [Chitinophagales bacterium]
MRNKRCLFILMSALLLFHGENVISQVNRNGFAEFSQSLVKDSAFINRANRIADSLIIVGKFDDALNYLNESLITINTIEFPEGEARTKYLLGKASIAQSKDANGMAWITQAQVIYDSINNKNGIADCLLQFGVASYSQKDFLKALSYFNDAEKIYNGLGNKAGSAKSLYLGGLCLLELQNYEDASQKLLAAEKLMKEIGDQKGLNECHGGLADLYLRTRQYSKSKKYYEECLNYFIKQDNREGVALDKYGIGMVYMNTGNQDLAKKYFHEAFNESKTGKYFQVIIKTSQALMSVYESENDFANALRFQTEYYTVRDSVFNIENERKMANLQYDLDRSIQQSAIESTNQKLSKEKTVRYLLIIGVGLLIILVVMAYQRYRFKHRTNMQLQTTNESLEKVLQDLRITQKQLVQSEKLASLGQLTAGIAHELNNPINFVSGNIKPLKKDIEEILGVTNKMETLLADKKFENEFNQIKQLKESIDFENTLAEMNKLMIGIEEGSKRTAQIVKGLRNFSRTDEEEMKKSSINEGIDSTLILLQNKLRQQNIEVIKSEGNLPLINCYPGQLNQVFMNLLTNAIDAIGSDGKIFITTAVEGNQLKISVRDTGSGINDEVKQKIFDPFFTTKEVGKGTGLGLSISYGIIEKHNGTLDLKSEQGKGTEFVILLPVS